MNFSIPVIISRLIAPRHEMSCPRRVWRRLLRGLRESGRRATRESGAFLLGFRVGRRVRVVDFVLYDDIDPHCLDTGIVRFDGAHFGALWEICEKRKLAVVADIHVHPCGVGQSGSDRAYPMISRAGHLALIVGNYAAAPVRRRELGIYKYRGSKRWETVAAKFRKLFLHIGL